jgi:hypothetical protein
MNKPLKIIFAPGSLDNFDGSQEELDALVLEIQSGFETGEFFENSTPLSDDDWNNLDDADRNAILKALEDITDDLPTKLH